MATEEQKRGSEGPADEATQREECSEGLRAEAERLAQTVVELKAENSALKSKLQWRTWVIEILLLLLAVTIATTSLR